MTAGVFPQRGYYWVVLQDGTHHFVRKDKTCWCGVKNCPAISDTELFLREGFERAPDPILFPIPSACPVCGSGVVFSPGLSSHARGLGWLCTLGGQVHYWMTKWEELKPFFVRQRQAERETSMTSSVPVDSVGSNFRLTIIKGAIIELDPSVRNAMLWFKRNFPDQIPNQFSLNPSMTEEMTSAVEDAIARLYPVVFGCERPILLTKDIQTGNQMLGIWNSKVKEPEDVTQAESQAQ